jgi:hypothetical protein
VAGLTVVAEEELEVGVVQQESVVMRPSWRQQGEPALVLVLVEEWEEA